MTKKLKTHLSTCPNDTFMFDALLHGRVDTEELTFEPFLADIEELNALVLRGIPDISKCSCAVLPALAGEYQLLRSGSALGRGNGPLLVSRKPMDKRNLHGITVAIPGEMTTANLLLKNLFPEITDTRPMLFSEIIPAVAAGALDAGVLIHEGRFVYADRGLSLIADLGLEWEAHHGLPLPLGAIVVRKSLPKELKMSVERMLSESVQYAFAHPEASRPFIREHAQELEERVMQSHIDLFVNDFSVDLGDAGLAAVERLVGPVDTL